MNALCPVSRQMRRTSSCSVPRVSASSAENGSSISMIFGMIDSARDADALLHAARQFRGRLVLRAGQPHQFDETLRVRLDPRAIPAPPFRGDGVGDVAKHGTPRKQRVTLEDHGAVETRSFDRLAVHDDRTIVRFVEAGPAPHDLW